MRGIAVDADALLVVPGVAATLNALPAATGLVDRRVALEDPGYAEAWTAFDRAGVRLSAVPVDDDGLDPDRIPPRTAAVYVTPSHQYPLGARMPVTRRVDLLAWAERHDGLVIEDDYDGEFRYDVSPLPALRSLPGAEDRVLYIGTASKLIAPTLRVAWLLPPPHLLEPLRRELHRRELVVNEATGLALADFFASGAATTHHARASRTYAARRAALVDALREELPHLHVTGVDAGLHVVLRLPDESSDHEVADALAARGVAANPLSAYAFADDRVGLVLCYAGLPETQARAAARELAAVVRGA
jgi:GntR family transcriptional regulator/MocR family aminotransferase